MSTRGDNYTASTTLELLQDLKLHQQVPALSLPTCSLWTVLIAQGVRHSAKELAPVTFPAQRINSCSAAVGRPPGKVQELPAEATTGCRC